MAGDILSTETEYSTGPIEYLLRQVSMLQRFRDERKVRFDELTDREIEVLTLIASGLKNPAIAKQLGIARTTVQNHRALIREKLNISHQSEFVKYALAYDLIQF